MQPSLPRSSKLVNAEGKGWDRLCTFAPYREIRGEGRLCSGVANRVLELFCIN